MAPRVKSPKSPQRRRRSRRPSKQASRVRSNLSEITTEGGRIVVRAAQPRDAKGWITLVESVAAEGRFLALEGFGMKPRRLARYFQTDAWTRRSASIVAVHGDLVVGQLAAFRDKGIQAHTAELGMSVASAYRRRRVGSALIRGAVRWAGEVGIEKLCLSVFPHNTAARELYAKAGFVEEGHRIRQAKLSYGYEDLIDMALYIDP